MNSVLTNGKHWAVENWTKSAHTHKHTGAFERKRHNEDDE